VVHANNFPQISLTLYLSPSHKAVCRICHVRADASQFPRLFKRNLFLFRCQAADAGPLLYVATGGSSNSSLHVLDPTTGSVVSTIGPIGFSITGLTFDPTSDMLYGSTSRLNPTNPKSFISISLSPGAGTLIGSNSTGGSNADIAFDSAGILYGWSEASDDLVTIKISIGASTVVADFGSFTRGSELSFDLIGTLWFAGHADSAVDSELHTVSPTTGLATWSLSLTPTTSARFNAMAFDGTTMFASRNDSTLHTIDLTTGAVTLIGSSITGIDAIAFQGVVIPEPSSLALLSIGAIDLFGYGWRRKRKQTHTNH